MKVLSFANCFIEQDLQLGLEKEWLKLRVSEASILGASGGERPGPKPSLATVSISSYS